MAEWQPIETAQMWEVAVVTDGERAAVAQLSLNDWREKFWSCDPEDGLDWEPTHWMPIPEPPEDNSNHDQQ
jgi:hypothetical protein